jgi:hypothetical protein
MCDLWGLHCESLQDDTSSVTLELLKFSTEKPAMFLTFIICVISAQSSVLHDSLKKFFIVGTTHKKKI